MNLPQLDPNPRNMLGKGIFPPEMEARMLAEGAVFAEYVIDDPKEPPIIYSSELPIVEAETQVLLSARESLYGEKCRHFPVPSKLPEPA